MNTSHSFEAAAPLDDVLHRAVATPPTLPGVVAMVTDRDHNVYEGAAGVRRLGGDTPMTTDTTFALFSATKSVVATVALQLVEQGLLDLDAPAGRYAPAIDALQVLEHVDEAGNATTRPPKQPVTTRHLLTHTAGFAYDFFDERYRRLSAAGHFPNIISGQAAAFQTPLLFDPGEGFSYGTSLDWVGQVIEGITGQRLGQACDERLFTPLGMTDTTFEIDERIRARAATVHTRRGDELKPSRFELPSQPEWHCAGHGLYGTVGDYMKFIRLWLNDGAGPNGRVLSRETVEYASRRHLQPPLAVTKLPGVIPSLSNDAEFFPGVPKSWSLAFMRNDEQAPTGRPAGAQGWAGLGNLYYWIDRQHGIGGFWATQVLPFFDPASLHGFLEFETRVYQGLRTS